MDSCTGSPLKQPTAAAVPHGTLRNTEHFCCLQYESKRLYFNLWNVPASSYHLSTTLKVNLSPLKLTTIAHFMFTSWFWAHSNAIFYVAYWELILGQLILACSQAMVRRNQDWSWPQAVANPALFYFRKRKSKCSILIHEGEKEHKNLRLVLVMWKQVSIIGSACSPKSLLFSPQINWQQRLV